jgi:hypothetical protein
MKEPHPPDLAGCYSANIFNLARKIPKQSWGEKLKLVK